jgi:hypothetical protein
MPVCDEVVIEKPVTPKKPIITTPEKKNPINIKKDSIKTSPTPIEPKPIKVKTDSVESKKPIVVYLKDEPLTSNMNKRNQLTLSTLKINSRHVQIKMYDNGTIDNDSVSIFYNGNLLKKHVRLTEEPIILELDLDENTNSHEITLYAENMGLFPPNTALIVVTCGKKRYELHSSTNFNDNNVLKLEYESPN